jgi:hypothetical protein
MLILAMSNQGGPPEQDDSMWRDLARMEAEVVDPEEAQTAHFDYNQVRAQIEALNPQALQAADAMFGDELDEDDDDDMATIGVQQPAPLPAAGQPARPYAQQPAVAQPSAQPSAQPFAQPPAQRPAQPFAQPPAQPQPRYHDDFAEDIPTRQVDGQRMAALIAKAEQAGQPPPQRHRGPPGYGQPHARAPVAPAAMVPTGGLLDGLDDDDDDDDFDDEPTMIAPSSIDAMMAEHNIVLPGVGPRPRPAAGRARPSPAPPAAQNRHPAAQNRPLAVEPPAPHFPAPAPSRPEASNPGMPAPASSGPGLAAPPAAAPVPPAAPIAAPKPAPEASMPPRPASGEPRRPTPSLNMPGQEVDLVQLMNEQKRKDTLMWVIAGVLFAVGVIVLVMKVL